MPAGVPRPAVGMAVAAVMVAVSLSAACAFAVPAAAQPTTTTTTAPTTTTTTLAPTTTTTAPTTTTTLAPTTTTTHHATTTTTHPPTTTTTVATSSSSTPWGWIILAIVLALAALLLILLIARNRRQGREAVWERSARPAVASAELARDLILSQTESDDPQRRANVAVQVDDAVDGLERAAASAPDDTTRGLSERCADSLRGLAFAVEADHLMRSGGEHATGQQLAAADQAKRNRMAEFDAALQQLNAAVTPQPARNRG